MTREETKKAIKVMQAYVDGKTIEFNPVGSDDWIEEDNPNWNYNYFNYRIKPEPHYRPFKNAEEVMEAIKQHGPYIKENNTYRYLKKFTVMENGEIVYSFSGWSSTSVKTWNEVYSLITWADGTPFGKLES